MAPLPTTGRKLMVDASSADDLWNTLVSGGPHTGTPVEGSSVAVWDSEEGANLIFKQSGASPLPVWRATTPLLRQPWLDFSGGQRLLLANNAGTAQPLSAIITPTDYTVLVAFYARTVPSTNTPYNGAPLV